jgi:ATP-dependent DNA helicase RecQ
MVFSDSVLNNLVIASPKTISQLLTVSGIGQEKADRLGADIIAICRAAAGNESGVIDSSNPRNIAPSRPTTSAPKSSTPRANKESTTQARATEFSSRPNSERSRMERVEGPMHFSGITTSTSSAETFTRQRATTPEPTDSLTPEQQALDERLRDWRKAESERLGLPLFFVLASTTLRNIVLTRPQNLIQLKSVQGLGLDKIEKFGPGIIQVCTS